MPGCVEPQLCYPRLALKGCLSCAKDVLKSSPSFYFSNDLLLKRRELPSLSLIERKRKWSYLCVVGGMVVLCADVGKPWSMC